VKKTNSALVNLIFSALFFALLLLCIVIAGQTKQTESSTVAVYCNGALFGIYPLDPDQTISVEGKLTLCIKNGKAYVQSASCPDQYCVRQGELTELPILCLPQGIEIRFFDEAKESYDAVVL